jgi:short-subunit dehydrogenase
MAKEFARAGYALTLVARRKEELERVASSCSRTNGAERRVLPYDLADLDGIEDLVRGAEEGLGPVDVLINNAGMTLISHSTKIAQHASDQLIRVNLLAPLRLTRAVLPGMIARRSGTLVDIASVSAFAPAQFSIDYNASKAGLAAASESLRAEVKGHGVHVLTVYPGPVETPLLKEFLAAFSERPKTVTGNAEELARLVLRGVQGQWPRIVYPRAYHLIRLMPGLTRVLMDTFLPSLRS